MSRRTLADANKALLIHQLRQDAALHKLRAQQAVAWAAREKLDRSVEQHLASEQAWAAALHDIVDASVIHLWRAHTAERLGDVRTAEHELAGETASASHLSAAWVHQVRLTEAVQDVVQTIARKVRRADEERRLDAAEDARMARMIGS